jgi:hypothetical protein
MGNYDANDSGAASDPFSRFWVDLMSKMSGTPFAPTASQMQDDAMKRTRQAFFDAWAQHCDEFLRSDAFLEVMKKSMDSALAFKQELNEFMTKALHDQQMPARSDTDSILVVLRSMEDRVLERIDRLSRRVDALELPASGGSSDAASGKRRPKGVPQ